MTSTENRIIRNSVFIFLGRTWFLLISLVLTPYLVVRIGNEAYGIWVLVGAFVGYVGLADFGFGTSFVKHIAEYEAKGDQDAVNAVLGAGLLFYSILSIFIAAAAYLLVDLTLQYLVLPIRYADTTRFIFLLGIIASLFANFINVYQSVLNGLQRMGVSNLIMVGISVLFIIGTVVAVELGAGIKGIAIAQLITQILGVGLSACVTHYICPNLRYRFKGLWSYSPTLFRYGLNVQISSFANLVNLHFDKIALNQLIDTVSVTVYDIGSRIPLTARSFPILLLSSLTPATAELEARGGKESLYGLYENASKYIALVSAPVLGGIIAFSPLILQIWVGKGYDDSALISQILAFGFLFSVLSAPVSPLVQGIGRPDFQRNSEAISLGINIILSTIFIKSFGLFGAPLGTASAIAIASLYYLWAFHRHMEHSLVLFLKTTYMRIIVSVMAAGIPGYLIGVVLLPYANTGRFAAFITLVLCGLIFIFTYLGCIVKSGVLLASDIDFILGMLRRSKLRAC